MLLDTAQVVQALREPATAFLNEGGAFFESLPDVEVKSGIIKAQGEMPMKLNLFKNYQDKPVNVLIDTNNTSPDPATLIKKMGDESIFIAVYKDSIAFYNEENKGVDIRTTESIKDQKIDHAGWMELWAQLQSFLTPVAVLTFGFAFFLFQLVAAFLGAVVLFIVAPLFKVPVLFNGCMRLSCAAKVPVTVLFLLLPPNISFEVLIWFGFAAFGLLSNRPTKPQAANIA